MTVDTDVRPPEQARRGTTIAITVLALTALLAVLDGTVVAVALDSLRLAFDTSLGTVVWVTTGYLLAAGAMLPLLGWATARFGSRRVFLTGLVVFVLGSTLCALAWSAPALIAFRVVQGLGGGLLEPTTIGLVARLAPRERVGRVMGLMSMIINVAPVLGPVVGGLLLDTGHWQWLFVVNIPFGVAVFAAAMVFVPPDAGSGEPVAADVRGLVLLGTGFVAVLFALNRAAQPGAAWAVGIAAVLGVALLGGYARHALTTRIAPAFDLRLLRRTGFAATLAVMGTVGLIMYSQLTSLPIFGAERHNLHGFDRGLLVCALGLGLVVSMSAGGRISDRTGPRPLVRAGSIATAAGLGAFALWHDRLPLPAAFALFVAIGLCFGLIASPTFTSVYRTLPPAEQAQGTTALFMTVQLAASLGVTVLGLLQARAERHWLTALFTLLAAAAVVAALLSAALPGRTDRP